MKTLIAFFYFWLSRKIQKDIEPFQLRFVTKISIWGSPNSQRVTTLIAHRKSPRPPLLVLKAFMKKCYLTVQQNYRTFQLWRTLCRARQCIQSRCENQQSTESNRPTSTSKKVITLCREFDSLHFKVKYKLPRFQTIVKQRFVSFQNWAKKNIWIHRRNDKKISLPKFWAKISWFSIINEIWKLLFELWKLVFLFAPCLFLRLTRVRKFVEKIFSCRHSVYVFQ